MLEIRQIAARRLVPILFLVGGSLSIASAEQGYVRIAHGVVVEDPSRVEVLRTSFYFGTDTSETIELFVAEAEDPEGLLPEGCDSPGLIVTDHRSGIPMPRIVLSEPDVRPKDSVWIGVPEFDELWKEVPVDLRALGSSPKYLLFGIRAPWEDIHHLRVIPAFGAAFEAKESSWMSLDDGGNWQCTSEEAVLVEFELLGRDPEPGKEGGKLLDGEANPYLHILIDPEEP